MGILTIFIAPPYFGVFGTKIQYTNPTYMLGLACGFGFLLLGLFFGAYVYGDKQFAIRITGSLAALFLIAYLVGRAIHRD